MRRSTLFWIIVFALAAAPAYAQLRAELVASGLAHPVAFVQDPSSADRQFIVEQDGRIRVLQGGTLRADPFLDLTAQVLFSGERGLLGLALAPGYESSGRLFVNYVNREGNTVIARFTRMAGDPTRGDPASQFNLAWPGGSRVIAQPYANHNGGCLAFGPDGYLYVALGDGGGSNDPENRAQDPQSLLGKILRLDVSVPDDDAEGYDVPASNPFVGQAGVLKEIWALGLRNPWKFSFDSPSRGGTGAMLIADVGERAWEEVNYEDAGRGGRNYGWRNREASHDNLVTIAPFILPLTDPIFEYSHQVGRSVTGGHVYRGQALGPAHRGRYFLADFITGRIWSIGLDVDAVSGEAAVGTVAEHTAELSAAAAWVSSFGEDAAGELYVLSYNAGTVYRVALASNPPPATCGTPDPFAALGGGTCVNGGWLPPGIAPPSTSPPPPPPPTTTPPPPSTTGCTTPDPFAALGGGTCVNGGWLPPGIAPPSTSPLPPPPPTTTPPPPSTTGCTTPDPFAALGGGTCVNGGWLPPGIAPPSTSAPPPPPPPPASTTGCSGNDPFAAISGLVGVCVNGGWVPVPGITTTGTARFDAGVSRWLLQADTGRYYEPLGGIAAEFQVEGLRVTFSAKLRTDLQSAVTGGTVVELLRIATAGGGS